MDPILVWSIVGTALLFVAVGVPLWMERVPPNALYGFRTPRTVSDERVWYPANRVLGRDLVLAGLAMAALMGLAYGAALAGLASLSVGLTLATLVPFVVSMVHGFWKASVIVAEVDGLLEPDETKAEASARRDRAPGGRSKQAE